MTFAPFNSHTNDLFIELGIIKVRDIISMTQLSLVYDFLNECLPSDLMSLFTLSSDIFFIPTRLILIWFIISKRTRQFLN